MAEISKTYNPKEIEDKWYKYWIENQYFKSKPNPDKEPYTIVIPPPNVTGVLHMGHMLNNTIQDVLTRKARMEGKEACWVPGTDHASIATEAKVVAMLKEQGINKADLTRDEFLKYCWEWTEKYGGIILQQLRKLGASCDWDRTRFTMEPSLYDAVIEVFVDLYNKGDIYRGHRMVNWDPQAKTTVSDEEVIMKDVQQKLYYIRYDGDEGSITIATVRPETIMADAAICVHPEDERFKHLIGKKVRIPLINREITIIADDYVEMEFGTGCLKVTPAHDQNDYALGQKHGLEIIDILTDEGKLNEKAQILVGEDRFVARKKIAKLLVESGNLVKEEEYKSTVGTSERTGAIIEPKLSLQWFLKMKRVSEPALENVMNDTIQLIPPKFKNTYSYWMENVRDWCISRQLWWGHRIPAFYMPDGTCIVAKDKKEALKIARDKYQLFALSETDLTQDEDVLDTWFSSWLWPISVFDGFKNPDNEDINYYYPTNDLVTAPEILFFWVARMIIAGYEYKGTYPFKNVYLTGIVRDKQGRKMSKSLGNSPDPIELIEKYGADGVRTGMLFSSPAGNDLPFDEKLCEQGRNFSNKIWNAFRLIKGWETSSEAAPASNKLAVSWFSSKMNKSVAEILDHYNKFRMSDALMSTYNLIWDDFCSLYLEMIKPAYIDGKGLPIDQETFDATLEIFDELMRLIHPWMPFISEELWQSIKDRKENDSICLATFPKGGEVNESLLADFELLLEIVSTVRNTRNSKQISPKEALPLAVKTDNQARYEALAGLIKKMANVSDIQYISEKTDGVSFVIKGDELTINLGSNINVDEERAALQKELDYTLGFKKSTEAKLSNERFVQNAKPEIIEKERQKLADADAKIKALEEAMAKLG
ncbi:Valyl-tRNA synthetase [Emticicia oligotrophica DSM 17448]|uniref:Valine--tRNA ligase n=1 Tax=Emticicia oligotrophica (strain DSM 17448 / CIP 109782 / MTCC 6937 / GPTSA100-15) TaxID=929562 RepID=A0ABM5N3H1_EMTOG|nr:valine--tRNA ligase [Emticicia oligotrophica]AFK03991.1 Valyl-tRNA synthetase [Emticicia oligotrophica DSM 17448]